MKLSKIIGIVLLAIVVVIAIAMAVLPSKAHTERSIVVHTYSSTLTFQMWPKHPPGGQTVNVQSPEALRLQPGSGEYCEVGNAYILSCELRSV